MHPSGYRGVGYYCVEFPVPECLIEVSLVYGAVGEPETCDVQVGEFTCPA